MSTDGMTSRRDFIKRSGMLVVSVGAMSLDLADPRGAGAQAAGPYPDPDFRQLDSWIVIRQDNTATFYVGKTDLGQGTGTAFRQIMSDELDMPYDRTSLVMGVTDLTVDQGGSGGSDALQTDGYPMRLWDKRTGQIDRDVAREWRKYDLRHILETNWATLGRNVGHKLNVYVGDMDSYYLNNALELMNDFLSKAQDPPFTGKIVFERKAPHCWGPRADELHKLMIAHVEREKAAAGF